MHQLLMQLGNPKHAYLRICHAVCCLVALTVINGFVPLLCQGVWRGNPDFNSILPKAPASSVIFCDSPASMIALTYMHEGKQYLRIVDDAAAIQEHALPFSDYGVESCAIPSTRSWFACVAENKPGPMRPVNFKLLVTTDGGQTWNEKKSVPGFRACGSLKSNSNGSVSFLVSLSSERHYVQNAICEIDLQASSENACKLYINSDAVHINDFVKIGARQYVGIDSGSRLVLIGESSAKVLYSTSFGELLGLLVYSSDGRVLVADPSGMILLFSVNTENGEEVSVRFDNKTRVPTRITDLYVDGKVLIAGSTEGGSWSLSGGKELWAKDTLEGPAADTVRLYRVQGLREDVIGVFGSGDEKYSIRVWQARPDMQRQ